MTDRSSGPARRRAERAGPTRAAPRRAKSGWTRRHVRNPRSTRSTTGRSGPCCLAKRSGYTRRKSSRCCSTSRKSGDSRARRGRYTRAQISTPSQPQAAETGANQEPPRRVRRGRQGVGHEGGEAHALAASGTDERIHLVDLCDEPGPAWEASAGRRVRFRHDCFGRSLARTADAVGVFAVEQRPVLSGVGDVVAHAGQPLARVESLEVAPARGIHPGAVEDGLLAVEVDELSEGF